MFPDRELTEPTFEVQETQEGRKANEAANEFAAWINKKNSGIPASVEYEIGYDTATVWFEGESIDLNKDGDMLGLNYSPLWQIIWDIWKGNHA